MEECCFVTWEIWFSKDRLLSNIESMLLEVQCEVSTVSDDLGCHVICWCWSTVFSEVHSQRSHLPGHFRALHASFCWQALWRCWFHFPAGLGTCPHCQRYQKLVQWPCVTVLDWPANSPDLNLIENLWSIVKRKMRNQTQQYRWPEDCYQSNLGFITPEQCHRLIDSVPRRIDAVIHAKGAPTKYWEHRNEHTFRSLTSDFLLILCNNLIFWDFSFGFSLSVSHNHQNCKK